MMVDVYAHLDREPADALTRAGSAGVEMVLAAATDPASSRLNAGLAATYGQVRACIGIHPWRAHLFGPETEEALEELAQAGGITAVSETGIDRVRRMAEDFRTELPLVPLAVQIEAFRGQVRLAVHYGLILVLHDRGSTQEILRVIDEFKDPAPRGIVHGFSGTADEALQYRSRGFLISVHKRNLPTINPTLEVLTLDGLVLETDSNDPAGVVQTAEALALVKGVTMDEVAERTTANVHRLLGGEVKTAFCLLAFLLFRY